MFILQKLLWIWIETKFWLHKCFLYSFAFFNYSKYVQILTNSYFKKSIVFMNKRRFWYNTVIIIFKLTHLFYMSCWGCNLYFFLFFPRVIAWLDSYCLLLEFPAFRCAWRMAPKLGKVFVPLILFFFSRQHFTLYL